MEIFYVVWDPESGDQITQGDGIPAQSDIEEWISQSTAGGITIDYTKI